MGGSWQRKRQWEYTRQQTPDQERNFYDSTEECVVFGIPTWLLEEKVLCERYRTTAPIHTNRREENIQALTINRCFYSRITYI